MRFDIDTEDPPCGCHSQVKRFAVEFKGSGLAYMKILFVCTHCGASWDDNTSFFYGRSGSDKRRMMQKQAWFIADVFVPAIGPAKYFD